MAEVPAGAARKQRETVAVGSSGNPPYTGEERILKMSEGYLVGSELVVTDGHLKDYQGKVMKIDRHKRTAVLELEFLGRKMKVTVGLEVVRKV